VFPVVYSCFLDQSKSPLLGGKGDEPEYVVEAYAGSLVSFGLYIDVIAPNSPMQPQALPQ
jgi:hypothetical protein